MSGNLPWSSGATRTETESVLRALGLNADSETVHDFLVNCCFHGGTDTPSLSISKSDGKFICFNPACGETGQFIDLVKHVGGFNDFEALRFIAKHSVSDDGFDDELASAVSQDKDDFVEFDPQVIDKMAGELFWSPGHGYMQSRGFEKRTLQHFNVGYSKRNDMVVVPVYSHTDIPVGVIGRSIKDKVFKNSVGLPSARILFNLNNAKKHSSRVVIVESAFDAMRVHQAGYPNVVSTVGGYLSQERKELLSRYFTGVVIMTDNDKVQYRRVCRACGNVCRGHNPGRELGESIARSFSRDVRWAVNGTEIYPHGAKDAGDMTDEEIAYVIKHAVSDVEYQMTYKQ